MTVDARASAAGEIAYCSGTRISSLLGVRAEQVHFVEIDGRRVGAIEITWDKTRRGRMILLSSAASAAVGRLLQWPEVQRTGWLFASKRGDQPVSDTKMRELLHEAERLAGVPEVKGRAFHGFKRSFASADIELEDASLQSGTAPDMLRRRYRKANLRRMLRVVDEIDRVRAVVPTEVDA